MEKKQKKKIKGEILNITISPYLKEKISKHAKEKGYTMAGFVKELIIRYVQDYESQRNEKNLEDVLLKVIEKLIEQEKKN